MLGELINGVRHNTLENICDVEYGHSHDQDHITVCTAGRISVTCCHPVSHLTAPGNTMCEEAARVPIGEPVILGPGDEFLVKAELWHTVKALEKGSEYDCKFNDGRVEHYNG